MIMVSRHEDSTLAAIRRSAIPVDGESHGYTPLLDRIASARFVLIGEASHGTREFYGERALITQALITDHGFHAVAVEADWPDADRVNRYVRGVPGQPAQSPDDALGGFGRFPQWMWRNREVLEFVAWLRGINDARRAVGAETVGFYGLDLYSLHTSIEAVLRYLSKVDPDAAARARIRYSCFEHYTPATTQAYGYHVLAGQVDPCEPEVVAQLVELQRHARDYLSRDGVVAEDEFFSAEMNARLVRNAEVYYRAMFRGRAESWNLRDQHMAETLEALVEHLARRVEQPRIVVWAHNSHLGDARATEMGWKGELNLGQLVRERHGDDARLVGLTTATGSVTAAPDWDAPASRYTVQPPIVGSYESLFHETGIERFLLDLHDPPVASPLLAPRLERAIGVIYRPETERQSHYFHAILPEQFDVLLHFDRTEAVEPLEPAPTWTEPEPAETFPWGI